MGGTFHIVGKIVGTVVGALMACMGGVWVLQGLGLAFLEGSFMAGDPQWALYGAMLAAVGLVQAAWSATRRR